MPFFFLYSGFISFYIIYSTHGVWSAGVLFVFSLYQIIVKIVIAHNYYGSAAPSGENQVFEAERNLLRQRGNEVSEFLRHSDTIRAKGAWGALQGALSTPWNPFAAKAVRHTVEISHPDVVHVHNTFPLLSPAIFHAIGQRAARVLTLHNYRLFCSGSDSHAGR